jgi:hypothetical protein
MPFELALLMRIRGEYAEMPGLRLTVDQACRLFQLDKVTCLLLLDQLVAEGALSRRDDGMYCSIPSVRRRPVRADLSSVRPATARRRA